MIESVWNQRMRRRDAVLFAAIHGGRGRAVFRRVELALLFDRALHQRVFVHAKSLDPGHRPSRFNWESLRKIIAHRRASRHPASPLLPQLLTPRVFSEAPEPARR